MSMKRYVEGARSHTKWRLRLLGYTVRLGVRGCFFTQVPRPEVRHRPVSTAN